MVPQDVTNDFFFGNTMTHHKVAAALSRADAEDVGAAEAAGTDRRERRLRVARGAVDAAEDDEVARDGGSRRCDESSTPTCGRPVSRPGAASASGGVRPRSARETRRARPSSRRVLGGQGVRPFRGVRGASGVETRGGGRRRRCSRRRAASVAAVEAIAAAAPAAATSERGEREPDPVARVPADRCAPSRGGARRSAAGHGRQAQAALEAVRLVGLARRAAARAGRLGEGRRRAAASGGANGLPPAGATTVSSGRGLVLVEQAAAVGAEVRAAQDGGAARAALGALAAVEQLVDLGEPGVDPDHLGAALVNEVVAPLAPRGTSRP